MTDTRPRLVGLGSVVGAEVRTNDDAVFDWLRRHHPPGRDLFAGYRQRRVLPTGEELADIMVPAARRALAQAATAMDDIDLVVGTASLGRWRTPNDLGEVAGLLGARPDARILALNDEFATFNHAVVLADALIGAGRARRVLVVVGSDWTRHVDYHTAPAVSASDGAAAAVVAPSAEPAALGVLDTACELALEYWGGMYVSPGPGHRREPEGRAAGASDGVFHLEALGIEAFEDFATTRPPAVLAGLVERHGIEPGALATVCHQASSVLLDRWRALMAPGRFVESLATYANMTAATIGVNLAEVHAGLTQAVVGLVALGPEVSTDVVLLSAG